jgi:hypothetical protein
LEGDGRMGTTGKPIRDDSPITIRTAKDGQYMNIPDLVHQLKRDKVSSRPEYVGYITDLIWRLERMMEE